MKYISFKTYLNWYLQTGKNIYINRSAFVNLFVMFGAKSFTPAQLHNTIQNVGADFGTSYYWNKQSI